MTIHDFISYHGLARFDSPPSNVRPRFVPPCLFESFGIAYLEAWLSGVPVIAADLPAMRCVVHHEQDGLLVPYGDKDRLRETLGRLLSDSALARSMGEKGRQKALLERGNNVVEKKIEEILFSIGPAQRPAA